MFLMKRHFKTCGRRLKKGGVREIMICTIEVTLGGVCTGHSRKQKKGRGFVPVVPNETINSTRKVTLEKNHT